MTTVWKYPLKVADVQSVALPFGSQVLTVQPQHDALCLWALVEPSQNVSVRVIRVHGTGHEIDAPMSRLRWLSTFQIHGGAIVLHAFEETP